MHLRRRPPSPASSTSCSTGSGWPTGTCASRSTRRRRSCASRSTPATRSCSRPSSGALRGPPPAPRSCPRPASSPTSAGCCCACRDRERRLFADAPSDDELTLAADRGVGHLLRRPPRAARLPRSTSQRWRYNFRNRHGFTDAADAVFDELWAADRLTWAELSRRSRPGRSRRDGGRAHDRDPHAAPAARQRRRARRPRGRDRRRARSSSSPHGFPESSWSWRHQLAGRSPTPAGTSIAPGPARLRRARRARPRSRRTAADSPQRRPHRPASTRPARTRPSSSATTGARSIVVGPGAAPPGAGARPSSGSACRSSTGPLPPTDRCSASASATASSTSCTSSRSGRPSGELEADVRGARCAPMLWSRLGGRRRPPRSATCPADGHRLPRRACGDWPDDAPAVADRRRPRPLRGGVRDVGLLRAGCRTTATSTPTPSGCADIPVVGRDDAERSSSPASSRIGAPRSTRPASTRMAAHAARASPAASVLPGVGPLDPAGGAAPQFNAALARTSVAAALVRRRHRRSWALMPSSRSISGGPASRPRHASAISTMSAESKWARWAAGDSHFSMTRKRPGVRHRGAQVDVAAPRVLRVSTTYLERTASRRSGSAASKRIVTMVSSTSSAAAIVRLLIKPVIPSLRRYSRPPRRWTAAASVGKAVLRTGVRG